MPQEQNIIMNKLEGKVAIITGGASGIGEATARLFAAHGAHGVVIADIQDHLGRKVRDSIGTHRCTYIHCDIADESQVKSLVDSAVQTYGHIDIMFCNAGVVSPSAQTLLNLDMDQFDRLFAVNVRGTAACVKHAARAMVEGRVRGNIICTASVAGSKGTSEWTDYCMSKHAVVGLMRAAAMQLGAHGIRVNCVSPYMVPTALVSGFLKAGWEIGEVMKMYKALTSLKDADLTVGDVAEAVLFLAADQCGYITGHDLVVDGGYKI